MSLNIDFALLVISLYENEVSVWQTNQPTCLLSFIQYSVHRRPRQPQRLKLRLLILRQLSPRTQTAKMIPVRFYATLSWAGETSSSIAPFRINQVLFLGFHTLWNSSMSCLLYFGDPFFEYDSLTLKEMFIFLLFTFSSLHMIELAWYSSKICINLWRYYRFHVKFTSKPWPRSGMIILEWWPR